MHNEMKDMWKYKCLVRFYAIKFSVQRIEWDSWSTAPKVNAVN